MTDEQINKRRKIARNLVIGSSVVTMGICTMLFFSSPKDESKINLEKEDVEYAIGFEYPEPQNPSKEKSAAATQGPEKYSLHYHSDPTIGFEEFITIRDKMFATNINGTKYELKVLLDSDYVESMIINIEKDTKEPDKYKQKINVNYDDKGKIKSCECKIKTDKDSSEHWRIGEYKKMSENECIELVQKYDVKNLEQRLKTRLAEFKIENKISELVRKYVEASKLVKPKKEKK